MQFSNAKYNLFLNLDFESPENYLSDSELVSNLPFQKATNYRPRICYQKATCNQSPKSELLLIANRYQTRKIIRRKLVTFSFFMVWGNELLDATVTELGAPSYRPMTMPKASDEVAFLKTR